MKLYYQGQPKSLHVWTDAPQIKVKLNGAEKTVGSTQSTKVVYTTFAGEEGDVLEVTAAQLTPFVKDGVKSSKFFFL